MKNTLGICFLSVAIVCLCVRGENDEDCKEAHEQRGFCLLKHKYKEIQADSLSQCYMNCARESSCHSINFFTGATKKCEMNAATRATRPEDYTSCANSTYMDNVLRGMTLTYRYKWTFRKLKHTFEVPIQTGWQRIKFLSLSLHTDYAGESVRRIELSILRWSGV